VSLFCVAVRAEVAAQLPDVMKPSNMAIDDDNIYIADGATIWIYSLKDYKLKGKFGKKGEGPREFTLSRGGQGVMIFPQEDFLVVNTQGKVSFWKKDGMFIKEMKAPPGAVQGGQWLQPAGKNYVGLGTAFNSKDQSFSIVVTLYDSNLNKIKGLILMPFMKNSKMEFPIQNPGVFAWGDKIVTTGDKFSFNMLVFDSQGNKVAGIKRDYKPLKMYSAYKEEVYDMFKKNPDTREFFEVVKQMVKIGDRFPPIQGFFVADQKIYIQTYKKQDDKYEFFIYGLDGKFIKQVYLPVNYMWGILPYPTAVKNNTLYQLIENEDEETWELHATKIE
jgi:hypothetical protein